MTLAERIDSYHARMPYPQSLFLAGDGRIVGTWIMGNDYRATSDVYGSYPHGYLKRVKALFPGQGFGAAPVLRTRGPDGVAGGHAGHQAGGQSDLRVRRAAEPSRRAARLVRHRAGRPAYSVEDAERYRTTMVKRNRIMRRLAEAAGRERTSCGSIRCFRCTAGRSGPSSA